MEYIVQGKPTRKSFGQQDIYELRPKKAKEIFANGIDTNYFFCKKSQYTIQSFILSVFKFRVLKQTGLGQGCIQLQHITYTYTYIVEKMKPCSNGFR